MLQELGDRAGQSDSWDSLGHAHHHLGHHQLALTCFHHCLDLTRDVGDRSHEGVLLARIGDTYKATGDPRAARDAWKHALTILDELDPPNAKRVRMKLGDSASSRRSAAGPRRSCNDPATESVRLTSGMRMSRAAPPFRGRTSI